MAERRHLTPEEDGLSREFEAMLPAFEALLPLDPAARRRALQWLVAKLEDQDGESR